MVNEWQFFDISFHYFHSNQEIWHAAETFGSKHPNGFRKCMIGHFLHRPSELVVSSPTMTWKQNLPHELDWATVRAFTSTLRCTKNRFPYDLQNWKKKTINLAVSPNKKKSDFLVMTQQRNSDPAPLVPSIISSDSSLCSSAYGCLW